MANTRRKKSPVPSARKRRAPDIKAQIVGEIYTALERVDADEELLANVGSWRDTLRDAEVLAMLWEWNTTGRALHRPQ
jgi:hypothetical protein